MAGELGKVSMAIGYLGSIFALGFDPVFLISYLKLTDAVDPFT